LRNPSIINFLDGCAISIPCHEASKAPVGIMLCGIGGADDRSLLATAMDGGNGSRRMFQTTPAFDTSMYVRNAGR